MMRSLPVLFVLMVLTACGDDSSVLDASTDASGADASVMDATATDASDSGGDSGRDAGVFDGGEEIDAGDDAAPADAGVTCGDETAPVETIRGTEGVAVATDGTIYFSQSGGVGRRLPGMDAEPNWLTGLGRTMWGLALGEGGVLFAATPSEGGGTIYRVDTTAASPSAEVFLRGVGAPNGLIVADDGAIFFSDFSGDSVWRADEEGNLTEVTTRVSSPNGLLLDDDGALLVLAYGSGDVMRIVMDENWEEESGGLLFRADGNPDGIAKDAEGRYYITDNGGGRLLRYSGDFSAAEILASGIPAAANLAFGAGALDCTDLYVTSAGPMLVEDVATTGRP